MDQQVRKEDQGGGTQRARFYIERAVVIKRLYPNFAWQPGWIIVKNAEDLWNFFHL